MGECWGVIRVLRVERVRLLSQGVLQRITHLTGHVLGCVAPIMPVIIGQSLSCIVLFMLLVRQPGHMF